MNTGKTFSDINHASVFYSHSSKAKEIKAIIMKHIMKLIRICTRKETVNKAKSQHAEWDNICKPCNQLRFNMHSIQQGLPCWSSGQDFTFQHRGCVFDPWLGAKIPHALQPKNQNIKQKQSSNKYNKSFKNGPH